MGCDQLVDNGSTCFEPRKRASLVTRHQPAVAGHVRGKDRRGFVFDRRGGQRLAPPPLSVSRNIKRDALTIGAMTRVDELGRFP
jgi:hypothetical protein